MSIPPAKVFDTRVALPSTLTSWKEYADGWRGLWLFLVNEVWTRDETDAAEPVKRFPQMDYLYLLMHRWEREPLLSVPKSRRMIISWSMMAAHLWDALTHDYRAIYVVSRKLASSEELVGRCRFVYDNLGMAWKPDVKLSAAQGSKHPDALNALRVPQTHSFIQAVEQGADALRQFACSRVFCDEFAFWEKARSTWAALRPTIQGGGQVCVVSSPSPGFMEAMVHDRL